MVSKGVGKYIKWCIVGAILQLPFFIVDIFPDYEQHYIFTMFAFASAVGTIILISGMCHLAKAKNRNPWLCLLGLWSIIGLMVLIVMKDLSCVEKESDNQQPSHGSRSGSRNSLERFLDG